MSNVSAKATKRPSIWDIPGQLITLSRGLLALLLFAASMLAMAEPASAATTYTVCAPDQYGNFRIHQTQASWVRISDKACVQWIGNQNSIRAMARLRADWPIDNCSVSIPAGASCPINRIWKDQNQVIRDITFTVQHLFASDGYKVWTIQCHQDRWWANSLRGSANTISCYDGWNGHPPGSYWVRSQITYRVGNQYFQNPWTPWANVRF